MTKICFLKEIVLEENLVSNFSNLKHEVAEEVIKFVRNPFNVVINVVLLHLLQHKPPEAICITGSVCSLFNSAQFVNQTPSKPSPTLLLFLLLHSTLKIILRMTQFGYFY